MEDFLKAIGLIFVAVFIILFFSFIFAWLVMLLWNWLIPVIFGLKVITFWQAFGLNLLSGLLLKSYNFNNKKD